MIQTKLLLVLILSISLVSIIEAKGGGKGQKKGHEKGKAWKCNGEPIKSTHQQKKVHKKCLKESDNNKEDPCFSACISEGFKTVVDGKVDTEAVNKWIEAALPEDVQEEAKKENEACTKEVTEPLTKDDNCKSYSKLMACQVAAFKKICKSS